MFSSVILLMAGVAVADDSMTQSETKVKEKTVQSTTMPEHVAQPVEKKYKKTRIEKQRQTTTSDDAEGSITTQEKVEMEKQHSKSTSESSDEGSLGSTQEYQHHSESYQHTTKETE